MSLSGLFQQRLPALLLTLLAACGGEDLVLPDEGIPTSIVVVDGDAQAGTIGTELADPVVVRVLDVQGRPVQGQQVTFTVITGGGSIEPATPTTNANGQASTSWTLGPAAGTQQLRARATGGAAPADLSVAINATASASAASAIEAVSGGEQSATAGSTLSDSLIVRVTDAAQNPVAGIAVAWTVTGGGSVSEPSTVTGADGRTGVRRTLGTTAGAQATIATVAGLSGSPVTFPATATVGSAGQLVVTLQPSATAASGAAFAQQPRVQIQDANGNNVAIAGRAITAELVSGPAGSDLIGTPTVGTNAAGLATFTNLGITGPAGSYTLNFTGANLTGATSNPITLTAGAATRLAFTVQPSSAEAGVSIAPAVRVTIQDALGQTVTTATNAVTLSIGANPGSGTLGGTTTVGAVNGVATFANLTINRTGAGYTLTATAGGLTGAASSGFNIAAGPAAAIAASNSAPATTVAGGTVAPAPAVRVTDASGNPVAGVNVTFAVVGGAGSGSVSGATQTTSAAGIATVGSWTIGTSAGTEYSVTAAAGGLSGSPVTFSTIASAGTAGKLVITVQPAASATSGVPLTTQPRVQLLDLNDNPVLQPGISITATILTGPDGNVSGATVNTNASGVAVFGSLAISGPSGEYTLNFGGTNITPIGSGTITLGAGAATKIAIVSPPPPTVAIGEEFSVQIQLQDAAGNPVGDDNIIVTTFLQPPGGAALNPVDGLSIPTNSSGIATFSGLNITGNLAPRALFFASGGLPTISSQQIQVVPGPVNAAQSTIVRTPAVITAGNPGGGGSTITVTARDESQNPIPNLTVVLLAVSGAGSFSAIAPTNASGVATATFTSTVAGPKTIGAEIAGVTIAGTVDITVNPVATTTAVTTSGSPSLTGVPVTFTATVSATSTPGGSVNFHDGGTCGAPGPTIGSDQLNGAGVASIVESGLAAGAHTIVACYAGNAMFGPSGGSVAQTVDEPANQPPTAADHAFGATEDQALVVPAPGVRSGASDSDGSIVSAVMETGPAHGTLDLDSDGSFTYTPGADYSGPDAFTYRAEDNDGAQSAAATVTLTVAVVNDAPSFAPGAPQSASSADGPQSVPGWATAISAGPGEATQAVNFEVTTSNDAAFAALPALAFDGTLTFEAAVVAESTDVTVTITARDNGGTASGGIDASTPVQVTITILP